MKMRMVIGFAGNVSNNLSKIILALAVAITLTTAFIKRNPSD
jgi:hypothetical protein